MHSSETYDNLFDWLYRIELRGFRGSSAQHLLPGFGERNLGARREPDRGELPLNLEALPLRHP